MDLTGAETNLNLLKEELGDEYEVFPISAVTGEGLKPLIRRLIQLLDEIPLEPLYIIDEDIRITEGPAEAFIITKDEGIYIVHGKVIDKHFAMTDFNSEEGVKRFQYILRSMGIEDALKKEGIEYGDTVKIGDIEFEFVE